MKALVLLRETEFWDKPNHWRTWPKGTVVIELEQGLRLIGGRVIEIPEVNRPAAISSAELLAQRRAVEL